MKKIELPQDYALVLQQVNECGEEDFEELAESLRIERSRLVHILATLRQKRLVLIRQTSQEAWIRLTARGQRLMRYMWPEAYSLAGV